MQAGRMHDAFWVRIPQFVGVCPVTAGRVATIPAIGYAGKIEATAAPIRANLATILTLWATRQALVTLIPPRSQVQIGGAQPP